MEIAERPHLRQTLGRFATGVTVMTARAADGSLIGITANSFTSLSLQPPMILWSLALTSPNLGAFTGGAAFVVNILEQGQAALARQFARAAPDKFIDIDYRCNAENLPVLDGILARLDCRVHHNKIVGDHLLIVAEVEHHAIYQGEPLLFYQGQFLQPGS